MYVIYLWYSNVNSIIELLYNICFGTFVEPISLLIVPFNVIELFYKCYRTVMEWFQIRSDYLI